MKDAGYNRTYQQCRDKIKKLKVEYRKEKDRTGKTGEEKSTWDYFQEMDSILGHKPSTRPPVVIESMKTDDTDDQALAEPLPESISNESDPPSISSSITSILKLVMPRCHWRQLIVQLIAQRQLHQPMVVIWNQENERGLPR